MKKLLIATACVLASVAAYAQGTVSFGNLNPVSDVGGSTLLGSAFQAELYAGPNGTSAGSLTAVSASITPFLDAAPGFFFNAADIPIPGVAVGATASAVVKVWKASDGATYEAALLKNGTHLGASAPFTISALGGGGPPPLPGATMSGMQSFNLVLNIVPEPSTIALGLLGAGALLLRRRK